MEGALRCHFFSSFFLNKLYRDEGRYNYANVSGSGAITVLWLPDFHLLCAVNLVGQAISLKLLSL